MTKKKYIDSTVTIDVEIPIEDVLDNIAIEDIIEYYGKDAIIEELSPNTFLIAENLDEEYKIELFHEIINKYSFEELQKRLR